MGIPADASATVDFAGDRQRIDEVSTLARTDTRPATGHDTPSGGAPDLGEENRRLLERRAAAGGGGAWLARTVPGARCPRDRGHGGRVPRRGLAASPRDRARRRYDRSWRSHRRTSPRFLREARATAALQHDHIVTIYHVGEERGVPFLAMPLLRGKTVEDRLAEAPRLSFAEVLRIGREAAEGLAEAHGHGLVHRDIKPRNMWLEAPSGRVKLLDFGLVRSDRDELGVTRSGMILGTPAYMSPEQAGGRTVDHRSDLFSLGCVLYRLATGRPPFAGSDPISTLVAVASAHPSPPCDVDPSVPAALSLLIMKLLEKNPDDRPTSARIWPTFWCRSRGDRVPRPSPLVNPRRHETPTAVQPKPAAAPEPVRTWKEPQPRRRTSGCVKAFAGCGVLTLAFVTLFIAGMVMLVMKGLPKMINFVTEETKRQNDWAKVARAWKPLPDDAGPDRLFPDDVEGVRLDHHDTEVDLRYLGIDLAGNHAMYGNGETAVEVFVFRVTASRRRRCTSERSRVRRQASRPSRVRRTRRDRITA